MNSYIELDVWIEARKLVKLIYQSCSVFPSEERFGISSQMKRSAISIPSNIAEGCGRQTSKDTIHFLHIAKGSLFEIETQVYLANDINFIQDNEKELLLIQITS